MGRLLRIVSWLAYFFAAMMASFVAVTWALGDLSPDWREMLVAGAVAAGIGWIADRGAPPQDGASGSPR